ncbi:MAG: hypothetical protein C0456_03585 [Hyphomonas sp.]|nr:hypothetical protein [Hyphomonas sp.]
MMTAVIQHTFAPRQLTAPAPTPEAMELALTRLNDLSAKWRATPKGRLLSQILPEDQRTAALSMLNSLLSPGTPSEVLTIVKRLLAHYPGYNADKPDSVAHDWVRMLRDQPSASIWACYERTICRRGQFAPSLGDFLQDVITHAAGVRMVKAAVEGR